jgi:hypothetical protein
VVRVHVLAAQILNLHVVCVACSLALFQHHIWQAVNKDAFPHLPPPRLATIPESVNRGCRMLCVATGRRLAQTKASGGGSGGQTFLSCSTTRGSFSGASAPSRPAFLTATPPLLHTPFGYEYTPFGYLYFGSWLGTTPHA